MNTLLSSVLLAVVATLLVPSTAYSHGRDQRWRPPPSAWHGDYSRPYPPPRPWAQAYLRYPPPGLFCVTASGRYWLVTPLPQGAPCMVPLPWAWEPGIVM